MARLPNAGTALVNPVRLAGYLLSRSHPVGGPKAAFFARFGFDASAPHILATALLRHASLHEVAAITPTPYGTKFEIAGPLDTPDGRSPLVRTVWIILYEETDPRFVTAVPDWSAP